MIRTLRLEYYRSTSRWTVAGSRNTAPITGAGADAAGIAADAVYLARTLAPAE